MHRPRLIGLQWAALPLAASLAVAGCPTSSNEGASGAGGNRGQAGIGGLGGHAHGGGAGAAGGSSAVQTALDTCQAWCRNESRGRSCCNNLFGADCLTSCYEACAENLAKDPCVDEYTRARRCELDLECDDFFDECEDVDLQYDSCRLKAESDCGSAAAGCLITEEECLATYDQGARACTERWGWYVNCVATQFRNTCAECVQFNEPLDAACEWPADAAKERTFEPATCGTLSSPPAACGDPCPNGQNTECGEGTFCEANTCEAECSSNANCRREDACSVRGQCLSTLFGTPVGCSFRLDAPAGCGADCSESVLSCASGTFCRSGGVCDAECTSDSDCEVDDECRVDGTCGEITCGADMLPDGIATSSENLTCVITDFSFFDLALVVQLAAQPVGSVEVGESNEYELTVATSFNGPTIGVFSGFVDQLELLEIRAVIESSTGSTDPSPVVLSLDSVPCELPIRGDIPERVIMTPKTHGWVLDEGDTQVLQLSEVSIAFNFIFGDRVEVGTSGSEPTCFFGTRNRETGEPDPALPPSLAF